MIRPLRITIASVGIAAVLCTRPAAAEPTYMVEPCCDLCSRATVNSAYNTKFLQSFMMLTQGKEGWLFRSEDDLRTTFGPDPESYRELRRLRDALKKRGVELVMVYQPTRGLMQPDELPAQARARYNLQLARVSYTMTLERFRKLGIVVPDLTKLLYGADDQEYFFRADHHWTPYGAQRTARLVADAIRAMPSYAGIPKKKFVTSRTGMLAKRGTMQKAAAQLCGFGYPDQYVEQFATAPDGDSDLLADEGIPQAVLVGTSNSDNAYNFGGFLSEYLGIDILNESVTGGGMDGALLRYLPSDEFQKNPPKILIWELETYHNLSSRSFYRQVMPLVRNGCKGKRAILSRSVAVHAGRNETLFNGGGKVYPLLGKHYQLDLQFSSPAVTAIKAAVWYTNGGKETLNLKYSEYVDGGGRFVTELRSDGDWGDRTFLSLDIILENPIPAGVSLNAQLCARDDAPPEAQRIAEK